jgi:nicotinate-nucleotide adenylyltransferase
METIALFGGSFDPPHLAHEQIVRLALHLNGVEKVIVMPTYLNPFKSHSHAPSELRLKWLKSIFSLDKNVEVSNFEVALKRKVPTIETVKFLLKTYKKIYLIIGADNLKSLKQWQNYEELQSLVTFVVASRDQIEIPKNFMQLTLQEDISSTQLRNKIDRAKLNSLCSEEIIKFYKEINEQQN